MPGLRDRPASNLRVFDTPNARRVRPQGIVIRAGLGWDGRRWCRGQVGDGNVIGNRLPHVGHGNELETSSRFDY